MTHFDSEASASNPFESKEHPNNPPDEAEPVWTFRGYRLKSSEFTTAMVHYFRAEVQRSNIWRSRLDATTNWAVISTGAALTIAFSPSGFHGVILLDILMVTIFLLIEARRYRYYELWSSRIRLLETDFFAAMLVPPFQPGSDWAESLADNLLHPQFPISLWEAIGRRMRRNYLYIYAILLIAWFSNITLFPSATSGWLDFTIRSRIGGLAGELVILIVIIFIVAITMFSILTASLHQATGEVLPRFGDDLGIPFLSTDPAVRDSSTRPWYRLSKRRQQLLAMIITDKAPAVSESILKEMKRGVTSLQGTGMYTGKSHSVLICALTVTEVGNLKKLVYQADPNAFVIVTPAQEVFGRGFIPLDMK